MSNIKLTYKILMLNQIKKLILHSGKLTSYLYLAQSMSYVATIEVKYKRWLLNYYLAF